MTSIKSWNIDLATFLSSAIIRAGPDYIPFTN